MFRTTSLAVLALSVTGCGFAMKGPPRGHQAMQRFECSASSLPPVGDVVGGGLLTFVGLGVLAMSGFDGSDPPSGVVAATLATPVVFGASAVSGFRKASRCQAAKRDLAARLVVGVRAAPANAPSVTITISGNRDTIKVGDHLQLQATARSPERMFPSISYRWISSNDTTAIVGLAGRVTAKAPGVVTITARAEGVASSVSIVVVPR